MKAKAIILAAGKGTRMKSDLPKVLHKAMGKTMVEWAINSVVAIDEKPAVVIGYGKELIKEKLGDSVSYAVQDEQKGTGHAVMMAQEYIEGNDYVVVTYGDMILLKQESIKKLLDYTNGNNLQAVILTAIADDPTGLGRIVKDDDGNVAKIVEHKDASKEELKITEINTGVICFESSALVDALGKLDCSNAQNEYYLTDTVEIINKAGGRVGSILIDAQEALGTNDRYQLSLSAKELRNRINKEHMISGVSIIDPDTTYIDADVKIGKDTVIYPGCVIEGNTEIGERCTLYGACCIKDTQIADDVVIKTSTTEQSSVDSQTKVGPNAYLRPNSNIGKNCKIGDFVEIKNSNIGDETKISHLAYVGDADVGKNVNLGCGVVFVNYDGKNKNRIIVKDDAFVGCNTNLVSPVVIGKGAYTAAGSTITDDVPDDVLAIARSRQVNKEGWKRP